VHRRSWLLLVAALFASLALVAAGCGGDDEGAEAPAPAGETGGGDTGEAAPPAAEQVITIGWGAEPPSLDPGLATDTTSSNVLLNIMDPLVRLGDDLEPEAALAESWDIEGPKVTFHLRTDATWTNGDPVVAGDFEYAWKRTLSPELAADYAYQLYGIAGAQEYNGCDPEADDCAALADAVGVTAVDDQTLEVTLTSEQPWFIQQAAHHAFLAVHQATVEQFGDKWTEPENIVTNGPFMLDRWVHDSEIDLVKNEDWRDADSVSLTRVNGKIIVDGTTRVQAFEAGEIDALDGGGLPPADIPRLKDTPEYVVYPALGTYYYGVNIKNITDVNERRALALAINRQSIIDNIAQADQLPATGFVPQGMPGFDVINAGGSPWLPPEGDIAQAQELWGQIANPKTNINLFHNDSPGHKEIAVGIQSMWQELGVKTTIKAQEWAQFLEFLGPPPNDAVDVYRLGWIGDFVDAINFLELWTCDSGNNNTNFCNEEYDALVDEARATPDNDARYDLYAQAEAILTGPEGEMPIMPIYWYTYVNLENESIADTFNINLLDQFSLADVVVAEG